MDINDTWRTLARRLRNRLEDAISRVTLEEFQEQEGIFDHTSRWGRELLYLASNVEWNRRTREVLNFAAADSLETTIRVDVDLSRITHEAFRYRREPVWLPLLILAPPRAAAMTHTTANVVPTPLVRDATGADVPVVPQSEARRWIAAALAEIVLDMAPEASAVDADRRPLGRDHRLLFSAALYRVLREAGDGAQVTTQPAEPRFNLSAGTGRLEQARQDVRPLLVGLHTVLHSIDIGPGMLNERPELLIRRAARVLHALSAPSTIVVVGISPAPTATAYSVTLAPRPLERERHFLLRNSRAQVRIDLVLADPDADRVVEVQLPDGVSYGPDRSVEAEVQLHQPPRSLRHVTELILQISDRITPPTADPVNDAVLHCLADFTSARIDVARDTFRFHRTSAQQALGTPLVEAVPEWLDRLRAELRDVTADPGNRAAWAKVSRTCQQQIDDSPQVQELHQVQQTERDGRRPSIFRVLEAGLSGPRTAYVRLPAVENRAVRASPGLAQLRLVIAAGDSGQQHAARYSGLMSLLVLTAVLVYLKVFPGDVDEQVLASALTLFAAIQAGRIDHPDRSSLRGILAAGTSWVGVAPVLPTVLLGVALAFSHTSTWALTWIALLVQATLQLVLQLSLRRAPSWIERRRRPGMRLVTDLAQAPDHERVDVLRSSWWRSTTAGALLLGRPAHAYVVEHLRNEDNGSLLPTLAAARVRDLSDTPANILAVLRAGTLARSLTFIVFREYPEGWSQRDDAIKIDLDVNRLIAHEAPVSMIDVFIGQELGRSPAISEHPVSKLLQALRDRQSLVLDCQMPCLPPKGGSRHRCWGRIRVGLRSDEVASLSQLLDGIAGAIGSTRDHDVDLLIDMSTQTPPRWIQGRPISSSGVSDLTPAEMDVVRHLGAGPEPDQWVEVAACGYTHPGVESDILDDVQAAHPELQLAGLTTALLYGTSVVFVLGHLPPTAGTRALSFPTPTSPPGRSSPGSESSGSGLNGRSVRPSQPSIVLGSGELILVRPLTTAQVLGPESGGRLLRVHARSSDQPGTLSLLAEHLRTGLARVAKISAAETPDPHVWYVQTEVAYGRLAKTRMLIALPEAFAGVGSRSDLDRVEREVQQAMSAGLADPSLLEGRTSWVDARVLVNLDIVRVADQGDDPEIPASTTRIDLDRDRELARTGDRVPPRADPH